MACHHLPSLPACVAISRCSQITPHTTICLALSITIISLIIPSQQVLVPMIIVGYGVELLVSLALLNIAPWSFAYLAREKYEHPIFENGHISVSP
jgi:hypothetical protein